MYVLLHIRLVGPLARLQKTLDQIRQGDRSARADVEQAGAIKTLAASFNTLAGELQEARDSIEQQIELRSESLRAAAEVAQITSSAAHLRDLLRRSTALIQERFNLYSVSIYLLDQSGVYAVLAESAGEGRLLAAGETRQVVGARTLVGWVAANHEARIANQGEHDPMFTPDQHLPGTRSQAVLPLVSGEAVLGVLDLQSTRSGAFQMEETAILRALANLIATAIYNLQTLEGAQINLEESALLNQASRQVAVAEEEEAIYSSIAAALKHSAFQNVLLLVEDQRARALTASGMEAELVLDRAALDPFSSLEQRFTFSSPDDPAAPPALQKLFQDWMAEITAYLPVALDGNLAAMLVLASRDEALLNETSIQPYLNLAELAENALSKLNAQRSLQRQINELQIISEIGQAVAGQIDVDSLYEVFHNGVQRAFGEINLLVALFDPATNYINIPFIYEDRQTLKMDPFPLGEGLTSIVLRTRQPLLLNNLDEEQLARLGAKVAGEPARAWLGVPLMVGSEATGVVVLQDMENGERFTQNDVRLLTTMASQVALSIRNAHLIEQTRRATENERRIHELTSKVRGSVDLRRILETTATELGKTLGARRAKIEITAGMAPSKAEASLAEEAAR
jgi:GAF domain-containing protein